MLSDRGKNVMDQIRTQVAAMTAAERTSLAERQEEWKGSATGTADVVMIGLGIVLILLLFGGVMLSREYRRQSAEAWSETGLAALGSRLQGDLRLDVLGRNALDFLAAYLEAPVGAIYIIDADGVYRRIAAFATSGGLEEFRPRESLLGQAVANRRPLRITQVPAGVYRCEFRHRARQAERTGDRADRRARQPAGGDRTRLHPSAR